MIRLEVFVCDRCEQKKRLDRSKQHWCERCAKTKETEMRPVRTKLIPFETTRPKVR